MIKTALAALTAATALAVLPALADRGPNPDERAAIEAALKSEGYTQWSSVELDDGRWEIDDAIGADGKKYDLKLQPGSLTVMSRELDD